jgi:hypothetical protein
MHILGITIPFAGNEHEKPYDFGRYTSFRIEKRTGGYVFRSAQFTIYRFELLASGQSGMVFKYGDIGEKN